jgi:hypothetical protein
MHMAASRCSESELTTRHLTMDTGDIHPRTARMHAASVSDMTWICGSLRLAKGGRSTPIK